MDDPKPGIAANVPLLLLVGIYALAAWAVGMDAIITAELAYWVGE